MVERGLVEARILRIKNLSRRHRDSRLLARVPGSSSSSARERTKLAHGCERNKTVVVVVESVVGKR